MSCEALRAAKTEETLRDTLARDAPLMDPLDIRDIMGWEHDVPLGDPLDDDGDKDATGWKDSVFARWGELPVATRLAAQARYSYAWADAMLKERSRPL